MIVRRHAEHRRLTQPERERAREIKGFCTRHTREQGEGLEREEHGLLWPSDFAATRTALAAQVLLGPMLRTPLPDRVSPAREGADECAWLEVPYLGNDRCRGDLVPTLLDPKLLAISL